MTKRRGRSKRARAEGRSSRSGAPRGAERDVSAALMELASPLLQLFGDAPPRLALEVLTEETALIWNVAVYERVFDDPGAEERFLDAGAPPGSPHEFGAIFRHLLAAKRAEQPFDDRWIVRAYVVEGRDGDDALRAEWTRHDALSRDEADAVIEAQCSLRIRPEFGGRAAGSSARPTAPTFDGGPEADPWRSLLESAKAIHAIRPWDLHLDDDVFGLRVEGEGDVHWCTVMGAGGEFFGVALYRGDDGLHVLQRIALERDEESALAGFDGFMVTFNDREELTAAERRRIKAAGVKFRGRGAWPQVLLQRRGRLAADLPDEDASRLRPILAALAVVLELRCSEGIPPPVDLEGELPVYEVSPFSVELRYEAPGPAPEEALPPVDEIGVARLLREATRTAVTVEFGGAAARARVADDEGYEYVPFLFLAVDAATGVVLEPRLCEVGARKAECASHFLALLASAGQIPREVRVATDWIERAIAPTAEALGVEIVRREELPGVEHMLAAFTTGLGFAP